MKTFAPIRTVAIATLVVVTALVAGCTSFSSTMLHRDENNLSWKRQKHIKGVPVTLEVPTHLKVDVIEKHFFVSRSEGESGPAVRKLPTRSPIREVKQEFIRTKKIFMVDLKRPAAGRLDATIDFNADKQYFNKITTVVTDDTIDKVSALIAKVAPSGLIGAPTTSGELLDKKLKIVDSVVSTEIFEIDDPEFESRLCNFLENHLNCCHDCSNGSNAVIQGSSEFLIGRPVQIAPNSSQALGAAKVPANSNFATVSVE